jgi:hypothetical protein
MPYADACRHQSFLTDDARHRAVSLSSCRWRCSGRPRRPVWRTKPLSSMSELSSGPRNRSERGSLRVGGSAGALLERQTKNVQCEVIRRHVVHRFSCPIWLCHPMGPSAWCPFEALPHPLKPMWRRLSLKTQGLSLGIANERAHFEFSWSR